MRQTNLRMHQKHLVNLHKDMYLYLFHQMTMCYLFRGTL